LILFLCYTFIGDNMKKEDFYKKYISFLFKNVIQLDNKSILFVSLSHNDKLEEIIKEESSNYGIKSVYFNYNNYDEKNEFLLNHDVREIDSCSLFDSKIYDKYAIMGAYFLIIIDYYKYDERISFDKKHKANLLCFKTSSIYNYMLSNNKIKWTGIFIPNKKWINVFSKDADECDIYCLFNKLYMLDDDFELFKTEMKKKALNMTLGNFNKIKIINELGTNLDLCVENSKWVSIFDYNVNDKNIIPNYPSYEIYTSPNCYKTEGIVYGSKPIIYNSKIIDKYYFKFEDGKIVDFGSELGEDYLREIINIDEGSKMIGEVAIVDMDNPISKTDKIFYTTLLDENSSCHIALGSGFKNVYNGLDEEDKYDKGLNHSKIHIDLMIGTKDTKIYGYKDDEEILIYDKGKFLFL